MKFHRRDAEEELRESQTTRKPESQMARKAGFPVVRPSGSHSFILCVSAVKFLQCWILTGGKQYGKDLQSMPNRLWTHGSHY